MSMIAPISAISQHQARCSQRAKAHRMPTTSDVCGSQGSRWIAFASVFLLSFFSFISDPSAHLPEEPPPSTRPPASATTRPHHPHALPPASAPILPPLSLRPTLGPLPQLQTQLDRDLYFLSHPALEGRDAGTHGIEVAAAYIAHAFQQAGLQPAGDRSSFYQAFQSTTGVAAGTNNRLRTVIGGQSTVWTFQKDYVPFGFSRVGATSPKPVVFVGYGIQAPKQGFDEYANIDVKGKIVLILRGLPRWADTPHSPFGERKNLYAQFRYKLLIARTQGAIGALIVDPPSLKEKQAPSLTPITLARGLTDAGLFALHIQRTVAQQLLSKRPQQLHDITQEIERTRKPHSHALQAQVALRVQLTRLQSTLKNVLAFLPGTHPQHKQEIVVLGAHYDHIGYGHVGGFPGNLGQIHPGADDNASGTATILALARFFAKRPQPRSLLFIAFTGEERGLLGSAFFVRNPRYPLAQITSMINLDMVGRMRKGQLVAQGSGTSSLFEPLLKQVNQHHKLHLRFGKSGYGASDQTSFYTRKIPVLFFFTGAHAQYHRPTDTFDTLNLPDTFRVFRFVADITQAIAQLPKRPDFLQTATPQRFKRRGPMRVSLGTIPDYGANLKTGVLLSGVQKGSTAATAGLQGGDILLRIGRFSIRNIYDMVIALGFYQPGDTVTLSVQRNGQILHLPATFQARSSAHR